LSRVAPVTDGHWQPRRQELTEREGEDMVEEAISGRELSRRSQAGQAAAVSEQVEASRLMLVLVALGAVGVLFGFWVLLTWWVYALVA